MNIAQALRDARQLTASDSARLDAELLLCKALDRPRTYLFAWPEYELTAAEEVAYRALLAHRAKGTPIAHLLGEREFWSLPLAVNATTLIPRPDTERLVEIAVEILASGTGRVLDLGTGTGAIALAIASEFPDVEVVAVDLMTEAVALAEANRQRLELNNVAVLQSDWFAAVQGQFKLIVSNPPYIAEGDPHLVEGDVRFEPLSALVSGTDGLDAIRTIINEAPGFLQPGGWLLLEHGWQQAGAVRGLLLKRGFRQVQSYTDLGGNDRVSGGRWAAGGGEA